MKFLKAWRGMGESADHDADEYDDKEDERWESLDDSLCGEGEARRASKRTGTGIARTSCFWAVRLPVPVRTPGAGSLGRVQV